MVNDKTWRDFIRQCAADVIAGQLTTKQLRQALKNPRVRYFASSEDFRPLVLQVCEELAPTIAREPALRQEVHAAERRIQQLIRRIQNSEQPVPSSSPRMKNAQ